MRTYLFFILSCFLASVGVQAAKYYGIKVGGVDVTENNASNVTGDNIKPAQVGKDYKVSYNAAKKILTLHNIRIERTGKNNRAVLNDTCNGLTIVCEMECILKAEDSSPVRLNANTTLKSDTTVYITGGSEDAITVGKGATLTIDDARLEIDGGKSSGLEGANGSETVIIKDSEVKCKGIPAINSLGKLQVTSAYASFSGSSTNNGYSPAAVGLKAFGVSGDRMCSFRYTFDAGKQTFLNENGSTATTVAVTRVLYITDSQNFPDTNLQQAIKAQSKYHWDYFTLSTKRHRGTLDELTALDLTDLDVKSLQGINYLTELTELKCPSLDLDAIDISELTKLKTLDCHSNKFTTLDLSNHKYLTSLDCSYNKLTTLDLSDKPLLKTIDCRSNQLTSLKVAEGNQLRELYCQYNQLTALDVSPNPNLTKFNCEHNQLSSLLVCQDGYFEIDCFSCNNNHLKREAMAALFETMPLARKGNTLNLVDHSSVYERNEITEETMKAAKKKNWTIQHRMAGKNYWEETTECIDYDLWIEGKHINCHDAASLFYDYGSASFDPETNTLTFKADRTLQGTGTTVNTGYGAAIYSEIDRLTILLPMASGHKTIKVTATGYDGQNGIYLKGKTTIAGEGTLAASGKNGIYHTNDTLTIGGNVTVETEGTDGGLTGYRYKFPRMTNYTYYSTLVIKEEATVKAKGQGCGAISYWKNFILEDDHEITSPEGAHWKHGSHAVYGEDESLGLLSNEWVVVEKKKFNPADVNRDGTVDSADIVAVIKEMPDGDKKADVNGDGAIDSADIVAVIKAMK
jgi:hypothetical protein